ncbi:MAG TPA: macrolide ABC transporter ATP-binding protein [Candidatus Magasanikbacteria bacterium]|nr:macrolide ABC transporter ATP-binding protein [Candidatus Magasanikbacteria bacterium]
MSLIKIENLTKDFVSEEVVTKVLHGINLEIKEGEFVAIMGPSGSGKSTLMNILGFLDKLTQGKYFFGDQDVSGLEDDELAEMRSQKIGFIFQSFNLLNRSTTLENVIMPLLYTKVSDQERLRRAKDLLIKVGLEHRLDYTPNKLSGGEKQRVAIARALINNPSVIFADEPTGNLDSKSGLQVMKLLQDLNEDGNTIILVTHEKYTADHAKRIVKIKDGFIVEDHLVEKRQWARENGELTK